MKDAPIDVPWLKVFATGFKHGIKWAGVSLLLELPVLLGMLLGITSKEQAIRMAWGIPALMAGLGCLIALMGIIAVAYMKHRWFRYLALMFIVFFFGSQVMLLIFMPYVGIYGFIVQPPSTVWGFCIAISLYLFFLYWWSKIPIAIFVKAKVQVSIWKWIVMTANKDKANRKDLKKFIKEEL
ncbi:MAG: hypothetical protein QGH11_11320 [Pirellulaceae bacterium]|nr:hypothetical protein [Pirellulaceae bacterium]